MPVNTKKAVFYPTVETEITPYYDNAVTRLIGTATQPSLASKYGISAANMTLVSAHRTAIPTRINKAEADSDVAQESTGLKDTELADGKLDLLRIFKQIENSTNFLESDAEALGFRKTKTRQVMLLLAELGLPHLRPVIIGPWFPEHKAGELQELPTHLRTHGP